jgi:uncharacterized protein YbjT (DUF2867 family)
MAFSASDRPTVAVAGATGFVGSALRAALVERYDVIGLTRSPVRARVNDAPEGREEWRHCDLFDPYAVERSLEGADYAIYLVHSMHPSARLTQADFADLDLLLADNFARAAAAQGIEQILYVSGLIPTGEPDLPRRLQSRLEVEQTLGSSEVPLTTLRAGLIVGAGGTWLRMLLNLVRRLPVMVLPAWTRAATQPIAIDDVVRGMLRCLGDPDSHNRVYDVGGPEVMSYRDLLLRTADVLGLTRRTVTVPIESPRLSKLWVRVFSGAPWALVSPLIDSLRHQARVRENPLQRWLVDDATPFEAALDEAVDAEGEPYPNPREDLRDADDAVIQADSLARSVQRLPLPPGFDARDVADEYMRWLPRFGWPLLRCRVSDDGVVRFQVRPFGWTLLELSYAADRSPDGRQAFYVTGGLLADMSTVHTGRLEFRQALDGRNIIAAVHDFAPTLPWYVYNATQALAHLVVMNGFDRHLQRLARARTEADEPALSAEA